MSDPQDHTPDTPAVEPDVTTAPTQPIEQPAPTVASAPTVPAKTPVVIPVQRRFLIAGSVVGALAVVGLSFGAGFLVGDHSGDKSERRHGGIEVMRFEDQSGQQGRFPGLQQFPGDGQLPDQSQFPNRRGQQDEPIPSDQSAAPTAPSAAVG
ncbi:MAG: hypothetical protein LBE07_04625 [Gordonia sp. (in: high G+C Gram-positive bacteria)]|jgi:hypothetical protein|nr:hypothetical protein [Gordonia sp. (in: high G+C Gram-positive bacteria)]